MQWDGFIREIRLERERVKDFNVYPYSIPAVSNLDVLKFHPRVTFLVGENGAGKSTILEALAILAGLNPEGGSQNFNYSERPSESCLFESLRIVRNPSRERGAFFLRAETMFNVSTEIERKGLADYGWQELHSKSHGEAFLWVVQNRFRKKGLYLLDEPESALSPQRQLTLLRIIHNLAANGSQFVISTHSPILMGFPDSIIYQLDADGIRSVEYTETEHYLLTRAFLHNHKRFLDDLFSDEKES